MVDQSSVLRGLAALPLLTVTAFALPSAAIVQAQRTQPVAPATPPVVGLGTSPSPSTD